MMPTVQYSVFGDLKGPHIYILAPNPFVSIMIENAVDVACSRETIWQPLDDMLLFMPEDVRSVVLPDHLELWRGLWGCIFADLADSRSIPVSAIIVVLWPEHLSAADGLREIYASCPLPASLAAAILAVETAIRHGQRVIQGPPSGFALSAAIPGARESDDLNDEHIHQLASAALEALIENGAPIDPRAIAGAVNRARWLLEVAEWAWQAENRQRIAKALTLSETTRTLNRLASAWYYLGIDDTVQIAGETVRFPKVYKTGVDPWLQTLEWAAHDIDAQALSFILPLQDGQFYAPPEIGATPQMFAAAQIADELSGRLLRAVAGRQPEPPAQQMRITIDGDTWLQYQGIVELHISMQENGMWVGLELTKGASCSFWWAAAPEPPELWISAALNPILRSLIHLILAGIWHDLCRLGSPALPLIKESEPQQDIPARHWTAGVSGLLTHAKAESWIGKIDLRLGVNSTADDVRKILELAGTFFGPQDTDTARMCYGLMDAVLREMHPTDPEGEINETRSNQ